MRDYIFSSKQRYYDLLVQQNWYKLFCSEVSSNLRRVTLNSSFFNTTSAIDWIDNALSWASTSQGLSYWSCVNQSWRDLVRGV